MTGPEVVLLIFDLHLNGYRGLLKEVSMEKAREGAMNENRQKCLSLNIGTCGL
jgi:hypothetical protein